MSSLFLVPAMRAPDYDHRDAILVSGVNTKEEPLQHAPELHMTAHSTLQLGTYRLATKDQPAARPCARARIPFVREDVGRGDTWMSRDKTGAGCGVWRSSA